MEGPLLRNLENDTVDFKVTVQIRRIWEHWSARFQYMVDHKVRIVPVFLSHCLFYPSVYFKSLLFGSGGTTEGSILKDKMAKFKINSVIGDAYNSALPYI